MMETDPAAFPLRDIGLKGGRGFFRPPVGRIVELEDERVLAQDFAPNTLSCDITSAGLDIDFAITGQIRPLTPGLELSVYRIVQEALTNVLKHAQASGARVEAR